MATKAKYEAIICLDAGTASLVSMRWDGTRMVRVILASTSYGITDGPDKAVKKLKTAATKLGYRVIRTENK